MNYKMKSNTLLELAGMQIWEREDEELKYLHWFVYKDEEGAAMDEDVAREATRDCIRQVRATHGRQHHAVTQELLCHAEAFVQGTLRHELPLLQRKTSWFPMARIIELPIGRLHHLGATEVTHAGNISAASKYYAF